MIERLVILVAVLGIAMVVVTVRERLRPRRLQAEPGITVFTGPDCRLCPPLLVLLERAGAEYRLVDVTTVSGSGIRALPTVVVADERGGVALRRSGRSAIVDVETILAVAASGGSVKESA